MPTSADALSPPPEADREGLYRTLAEAAPVLLRLSDANNKTVFLNQTWLTFTGRTLEAELGDGWWSGVHDDDRAAARETVRQATARREPFVIDYRLRRHDGEFRWMRDTSVPRYDDTGAFAGYVASCVDSTEHKHAEDRLKFLVDVGVALTSSLDAQVGLQAVASLAVPRLADWCSINIQREDGTIGMIAAAYTEPHIREIIETLRERYPNNNVFGLWRVLKTHQPLMIRQFTPELLASAARSDEHLALLKTLNLTAHLCVPVMTSRGCIGAITLGSTQNWRVFDDNTLLLGQELAQRVSMALENARLYTTERRARQDAERATARVMLLQSVTAALSEAVTPQQVADVIIERALTTLGGRLGVVSLLSPDGAWLDRAAHGDAAEPSRSSVDANIPLNMAVRLGQPIWIEAQDDAWQHFPTLAQPGEQRLRAASANLPLVANGRVIGGISIEFPATMTYSDDDKAFLLSLAQLCAQAIQRAQLFADEQAARREAEHANALKLKFLAMISHELRTPLTSIKGFATSLLADDVTFSPDEQRAFVGIIDEEADKLTELIDQLMDLSRLQAGTLGIRPERQTLSAVVARAVTQLRTLTPQHQLVIDLPSSLPRVRADAQRIAQVLVNLVSNAVKYAPPDTEITLRARHEGAFVRVDVCDRGPGIPPEARQYVFEPFRQVDSDSLWPKKGAGLGLAICQGLVEAHGGQVWIDDTEGGGTTISFTLPIATPPQPASLSDA